MISRFHNNFILEKYPPSRTMQILVNYPGFTVVAIIFTPLECSASNAVNFSSLVVVTPSYSMAISVKQILK